MPDARSDRPVSPSIFSWTPSGRIVIFVLAAASIWCLLAEMYKLCDMRTFFFFVLVPATLLLYGIALFDRARGDGRLWRAVMIGTLAGLFGAVVYDVFRLPFVFSRAWGLEQFGIPQMALFKVFPRFGAMILGQPMEQGVAADQPGGAWGAGYPLAAHLVGWVYHFSNGATFGVMFAAMYARGMRPVWVNRVATAAPRSWHTIGWAVVMAVGIEICLLISPYANFFGIHMGPRFVVVTIAAHILFGLGLGVWFARHSRRWRPA